MQQTSDAPPRVGDVVTILDGASAGARGEVIWSGIDGSCGCRSVVVRLPGPREWWGRASEVRR